MKNPKVIAIKLHETLKKFLARASLVFLGADSCATNTGWKNGAIGKKHALKNMTFALNTSCVAISQNFCYKN